MTVKQLQQLQSSKYNNNILLDVDGSFLARLGDKKIEWYLNKGLAERVEEGSNKIQLKFKADNNTLSDDPFYRSEKKNICCACGTKENLTSHHVVPISYRRHFPVKIKKHAHHDILLMCEKHHIEYEEKSLKLRRNLEKKYLTDNLKEKNALVKEKTALVKKIKALIKHSDKMPADAIENYQKIIIDNFGYKLSTVEMKYYLNNIVNDKKKSNVSNCQLIVEKIIAKGELKEFVMMWRQHFLDTMNPEHLNEHWRIDHPSGMIEI